MPNQFLKGAITKRETDRAQFVKARWMDLKLSSPGRETDIRAAPAPEPVPITSIVANNVQLLRYLRYYGPGLII